MYPGIWKITSFPVEGDKAHGGIKQGVPKNKELLFCVPSTRVRVETQLKIATCCIEDRDRGNDKRRTSSLLTTSTTVAEIFSS